MSSGKIVSIVVPVYADWLSLKDCIDSLKRFVDPSHNIIIVNDSGPEADSLEANIKKTIKGIKNFKYHRNSKNLGFVKTCNRAVMVLDKTQNDIMLLNSDTKVTNGFLKEMMEVLYSDNKIGAVSPRTNNATIFTIPISAMPKKGLEPRKSFEVFQKVAPKLPRYNEVPTAHGFCMLIKRAIIKKYGFFDEIFGKGYGEEVDFCQRIKAHGYKSVLANHAFVFHMEARSFTLEKKQELLKQSKEIIDCRYPEYSRSVRLYIDQAIKRENSAIKKAGLDNSSPWGSGGLRSSVWRLLKR
jgi:GT2 family glycosyltransferase